MKTPIAKYKSLPRKLFLKLGGNVLTYILIKRSLSELISFIKYPRYHRHFSSKVNGLTMPPPRLIFMVAGHYDQRFFYEQGTVGLNCIKNILNRNNLNLNSFENILDFGCGCGRILLHLEDLSATRIYGTDYNPTLVNYSKKAYPYANITQNASASKLNFENGKFNFVYAISVFTHLPQVLQDFWIKELWRVLKSDGYLLLTLHGSGCIEQLSIKDKLAFNNGELVVVDSSYAGTNVCGSYHSEDYVRNWVNKYFFIVVDFIPGGMNSYQDMWLLQKKIL